MEEGLGMVGVEGVLVGVLGVVFEGVLLELEGSEGEAVGMGDWVAVVAAREEKRSARWVSVLEREMLALVGCIGLVLGS